MAILPFFPVWSQESENKAAPEGSYLGLLDGVKHASVVYHRGDDYELKCDVYVPAGSGPFPAVLAVHGGGWRGGTKLNMMRHAFKFCDNGFVVVCINYRHAPKFPFPAQIQDCFAAMRFMRDHAVEYHIDTNQIFGFGYSAGGHLISLLATTSECNWKQLQSPIENAESIPVLKGVAAGGAPCDFEWLPADSTFLKYWLGATKSEDPKIYQRASPVFHVSETSPPFLLFHGIDDQIVPIECLDRMQQALVDHGITCEVAKLAGCGHIQAFSQLETVDLASAFFRRQIAEQGSPLEGVLDREQR